MGILTTKTLHKGSQRGWLPAQRHSSRHADQSHHRTAEGQTYMDPAVAKKLFNYIAGTIASLHKHISGEYAQHPRP